VFKLLVPRAYGGAQASVATVLAVIEEIAAADGSAGWCAMIGSTSALMCAYLDDDVAREVYGPGDAVTCGVFAPLGRARRFDDGFRVSGRWPFASGCEHSAWRMGGAIVDGDPPLSSGAPDVRSMLFRAAETRVHDTWRTTGLRGTGSHDIEVDDVFVPASRAFSLISDIPRRDTIGLPYFGVLAAGVAAVCIGIARAALEDAFALARTKHAAGAKRTVASREVVQLAAARGEAKVRAGRAFLREALQQAQAEVSERGSASPRGRALLRLAAVHAASESAAAVDIAYEAGGATSIYEQSPLQRRHRDVHVATQHIMVNATSAVMAGRVLLGLESDTSTL
jgi:alkylation response protein AidB-like acyl-CoA dehydrogenase